MSGIFRLKKLLAYQWQAKTKYYLHSPFVYQFYLNVLEGSPDKNLDAIGGLRKKLRADDTMIEITDFGTGGHISRSISTIEKNVAIPPKYGEVLYRIANYFKPENILEFGTSIGISSAYLALGNPQAKIMTIEGSPKLIETASKNYAELSIENVETVTGSFDEVLPNILKKIPRLDMVFFDGNHRKDATLRYFSLCLEKAHANSIFIFDDIYYNKEMNEVWEMIKQNEKVTLTIDLYRPGICFFMPEKLAKENFVLRH